MTGGCAKRHTPAPVRLILIFIKFPFPPHQGVIGIPSWNHRHSIPASSALYSGIIGTQEMLFLHPQEGHFRKNTTESVRRTLRPALPISLPI